MISIQEKKHMFILQLQARALKLKQKIEEKFPLIDFSSLPPSNPNLKKDSHHKKIFSSLKDSLKFNPSSVKSKVKK